MTDMSAVGDASVDAVWSSHSLEHLHRHQVVPALRECFRVLKPGGVLKLFVPDLQSVAALIAEDKLHQVLYQSPAGPITVDDVLNSPMIAWPYRMLMCCLVTDGGGALILTSAERAKDFPQKPVYIMGTGESVETPPVSQMYDFTSSTAFKISGKNQLYGDGFAMWITKQRAQQGPVFGSTDRFEGLGIFIDTYKNNRPGVVFPYVMAMFGDGQKSYDKNTDGKDQELAGCSARGIRHASVPTKMRLTYIQDKQLRLELQYKTEDEWELCFETDHPPAIPNIAYLGFSAETGELSDNHDIISVSAKNLYSAPGAPITPSKGKNKGTKGYSSKEGGSWTWFFTKIFLFVLVAGGAYVGFTAYRAKAKSHRF